MNGPGGVGDRRHRVAVHASSRAWRQALQIHVANHAAEIDLTVVREARAAIDAAPVVVVADASASWLDAPLVGVLHRRGIGIVVVAEPADQHGPVWRAADETINPTAGPEALVDAIIAALPDAPPVPDDPLATWAGPAETAAMPTMDGPLATLPGLDPVRPVPGRATAPATGELTVLAGSVSAPVHEVAIALAAACSVRHPTVLVDAHQQCPRLARRLGYDLTPNLLGALERQRSGRGWPGEVTAVARRAAGPGVRFHSVVGVPPGEITDLNPVEVAALFDTLRRSWPQVLVVAGPSLLGVALGQARHRVLIGGPGRLGMLEVLDWLADHGPLASADRGLTVVLTGAPAEAAHRAQLAGQLTRHTPPGLVAGVVTLPADRHLADAEWQGELVPRGPFTHAVEQLAVTLLPSDPAPGDPGRTVTSTGRTGPRFGGRHRRAVS